MIHVIRTMVGWVVTYIILAIVLADPGSALILMALSVICTAGISLILWVPLGYGVGWVVLAIVGLFVKTRAGDGEKKSGSGNHSPVSPGKLPVLSNLLEPELQRKPGLTGDQQAITNYIKKARARGLTPEQITANLKNNGWSMDSINWGLNFVKAGDLP